MKFKLLKLFIFTIFAFSATLFVAEGVKAETRSIKIYLAEAAANGDEAVSGGAVDAASEGAINATSPAITTTSPAITTTSPAITTTPPAVTSPGGIQPDDEEEEENTTGVEVFDEFSVGGIFYTVTGIKGNKVYIGVSGIVNDRATTVFIPKKIKYKGNEMIVTSIEDDGFSYMDRLRKVVVGANITYIGEDAFRETVKFDRLVIKTNTLKKVGKNIFKGAGKKLIIEVSKKSLGKYKKMFINKGVKIKEIRVIKK